MAITLAKFPQDHFELIKDGVGAVIVNPRRSFISFFFPFIGAWASGIEIRENDPAQSGMMPEKPKSLILREINLLTECADIKRKVVPYCTLNYTFSSFGGLLSLTSPAVLMPHQHLFRPENPAFGEGEPTDSIWTFKEDETRFLICRELAHIKKSDSILRTAIKVALIAAMFVLYKTPLGWIGAGILFLTAVGIFFFFEKAYQSKMDLAAIDIFAKRFNDRERAVKAALNALEKMQKQNLDRREKGGICKLYITKRGNNILDFLHPSLSTRIERIQQSCIK